MKNFLIFVLGVTCLVLFLSLNMKTHQVEEQRAVIVDLKGQIEAAEKVSRGDAEGADPASPKGYAGTRAGVAVQASPSAPVAAPTAAALPVQAATPVPVAAAPVVPGQNTEKALGEFAATMKAEIATSPPPFVIFMDEVAAKRDAQTAEEQGLPQNDTARRMGIDRYNGFMTHLFPGRTDLRMVAPAPGEPENVSSSQVKLSPAKLLWVAVDDASPDAKYALRWLKVNSPQLTVTQGAMQALDGELSGNTTPNGAALDAKSAATTRGLHDAQSALTRLLNGRPPVAEDQREVAFFLRAAGVSR